MKPDRHGRPDDSPVVRSGSADPEDQTVAQDSDPGRSSEPSSERLDVADIPTTLGRFKINGVLGKGGFGTVYLGFDDRLKRSVAIKVPKRVLSGADLDKFLEEARRLAQLRHAGIVTVFDVGEFEGRCYIVSDYLSGLSLSEWMRSNSYGWRQAASITARLADALAHAHVHGTVHRDVKPSNVMMVGDDQPVLIDFGLAVSDADGARESPGMMSGTTSYMSPEQTLGKAHRIDGRTDIYCLGVMLYQLLCRKRPFTSGDKIELIRQIREDEPQPPRQVVQDIPLDLERVCLKGDVQTNLRPLHHRLRFCGCLARVHSASRRAGRDTEPFPRRRFGEGSRTGIPPPRSPCMKQSGDRLPRCISTSTIPASTSMTWTPRNSAVWCNAFAN